MIGKLETGFDDLTVSKYLHLCNFKYVNLYKFSNFIFFSVSLEKDSVR